jgi:type I restriction enzyme S subunit
VGSRGCPLGYKQTEIGVIPEDWEVAILDELSIISRLAGAEYTSMWKETINGEIIALRGFNIGKNKIIERDLTRISNKLSMKLKRSRLTSGDVIYPCVGTIGNAAVIEQSNTYHIQQNIARITPIGSKLNSYFLSHYLMSELAMKEVERFTATTSQPSVLVGSLRQYRIPLPCKKSEQTAIANVLSDVDKEIDTLEQSLNKTQQLKQGMMQELLTGRTRLV